MLSRAVVARPVDLAFFPLVCAHVSMVRDAGFVIPG